MLTKDPNYPATTQVLAHGVSTRKRKKQSYRFLSDEIKVQKDGFFPYTSNQIFAIKQLTGDKYKMKRLLKIIPELSTLFNTFEKEVPLLPVIKKEGYYVVSNDLLKRLHMSHRKFELMINEKFNTNISCENSKDTISLHVKTVQDLPIYKNAQGEMFLPTEASLYKRLPEILSHFLLLYNLSMICRYEAEWWGELLYSFSSNDRSYIDTFITCTENKVPHLMDELFFSED